MASDLGDLEDLEARVAYLEARLGTHRGDAAKQLRQRCSSVESSLSQLLSDQQLTEFMSQYEQLSGLLMTDDVDEFLMTVETKRTVLLSCEDFFGRTAALLEQMKELEQYAAANPNLQTLGTEIKPLKALHLETQHGCDQFSSRFRQLLAAYNSWVALCSHKFVHWDAQVSALERS